MKAKKFGLVFGEELEKSRKRRASVSSKDLKFAESWGGPTEEKEKSKFEVSAWRLVPIYFIFFAACLVLFARAIDLQIIRGGLFLGRAEGNRIQLVVNHAPRGAIFDRNGRVLAQNTPGYRLIFDPSGLSKSKREQALSKLLSILGDSGDMAQKFNVANDKPVTLMGSLPAEKALVIEAEGGSLPGIQLEINPIRSYPYKEITAHLLGYTAEADQKDIESKITITYNLGDQVGKFGIEQSMEDRLRGINGYELISVTAQGEKKGGIYKTEAKSGQNITLSIDIDLQKIVCEALLAQMKNVGAKGGSAVVLDSSTGEVLALVSIPSFDD